MSNTFHHKKPGSEPRIRRQHRAPGRPVDLRHPAVMGGAVDVPSNRSTR